MKIMIYAHELLSVVLTPFVLWLSLPDCAPAIVDFFREFTIHVGSLGYVCSFAVFDFQRHGNVKVSPNLVLVPLSSISGTGFLSPGYPFLSSITTPHLRCPRICDFSLDLWGTHGPVLMDRLTTNALMEEPCPECYRFKKNFFADLLPFRV